MVQLEFSTEDAKVLRESLEGLLSDLRYEINATDAHDYRDALKLKQALLERVIGQLGGS